MSQCPRPQRHSTVTLSHTSLTTQRGAALLLAVYLSAITLLLLGGISLQRTNTEMHATQVSRDLQQSFYLAESALDQALGALRANPDLLDGTQPTSTLATGTASYSLKTVDMAFLADGTEEAVRQITATGRSSNSGIPSTVTATIRTPAQLTGFRANGAIGLHGNIFTGSHSGHVGPTSIRNKITLKGDVVTALGKADSVSISPGVTVQGDVVIGPPDADHGYTQLFGNDLMAGVVFSDPWWASADDKPGKVTGDISAESLPMLPQASAPSSCSTQPWRVRAGQTYDVRKGDPLDQAPAGESRVIICVPYATFARNTTVTFHDPTLLYITKPLPDSYGNAAFSNEGTMSVQGHIQNRPDRGLMVIVSPTTGNPNHPPAVWAGNFEGSIYAPTSSVHFTASETEQDSLWLHGDKPDKRKVGFIVGNTIDVNLVSVSTQRPHRSRHTTATTTLPLVNWTN